MLNHFISLYWHMDRGLTYVLTNVILVTAAILLLNETKRTLSGILRRIGVCVLGVVVMSAFSWCNEVLGLPGEWCDRLALATVIALYAAFLSPYPTHVRIVRGVVYFACTQTALVASEPLGQAFGEINAAWFTWSRYLTLLVMVILIPITVAFMRKFSYNRKSFVMPLFVAILLLISLLMVLLPLVAPQTDDISWRLFMSLICAFLWGLEMCVYYLFYSVNVMAQQNLDLQATQHRAEMEIDNYEQYKANYDKLQIIRHEIKNHNFYIKSLLENGEYDRLREYLTQSTHQQIEPLTMFDCGNYAFNVVMNCELAMARERDVTIQSKIVVPGTLPFQEEDICSLMANLLENAIEAASKSDEKHIDVHIWPKQDYLFFRVINSVGSDVPAEHRLSLKTTKPNRELHGYGTKVIRFIAERYNGSAQFIMEEGRFITDVMLQLPKEES